ncbi:hypothetical protein BDR26DRAFT_934569 [Obelidium mucronatum]|nr:hypothetical protein BDR26DRAFT_934569 [Obelidium mucronatum]
MQNPPPNPQGPQPDIQPPPGPVWDPPLTAERAILNGFMRLGYLPSQGIQAACQAGGINPPPPTANVAAMRQHLLDHIRDNLEPFPMDLELDGYCILVANGQLKQAIRPPRDQEEADEDEEQEEEFPPHGVQQEVSDQSDGSEEVPQKKRKVVKKKKRSSKKSKRYQSSSESEDDDSDVSTTSSDEASHPKKKSKSLQLDILQSEFNRQPDDEQEPAAEGRLTLLTLLALSGLQGGVDKRPTTVHPTREGEQESAPAAAGTCAHIQALNYLAMGRRILNHAREAVRDSKSQKRDFSNVFLDDNLGRVKETFRNANMAINSISSKSAKSIMNGRDERKVSTKRLETAKRNMDTIQKSFAAPQLQSWTGLDAASWFLDNILLASNHSTNDKSGTACTQKTFTRGSATQSQINKYRSQRDYSKKDDYKREDYKRDERDRDRDFSRRDNTRFNPRVRIRSPPMERGTNDK